MTTMLHAPIARTHHFERDSLDSPSYPLSFDSPLDFHSSRQYTSSKYDPTYPHSAPSSIQSSPQLTYTTVSRSNSYLATPASSISLEPRDQYDGNGDDDMDDDMIFPSFEPSKQPEASDQALIPESSAESEGQLPLRDIPDLPIKVNDDHALEQEPSRHVDYLSHDWVEEDVWSSWKYIVHRRKNITNSHRLENASWRTWSKKRNNLRTVSPESLNWLKDCDVTWLYGPLQTGPKRPLTTTTPPPSRLSRSASGMLCKPILKKKSASAVILERSRSQHSLLQRASEIIRAQQSSPALGGPPFRRGVAIPHLSDFAGSSVANTPTESETPSLATRPSFIYPDLATPAERKHVNFDEEVTQMQAIDSDDDTKIPPPVVEFEDADDEDDDGGLVMAPLKTRISRNPTPRGSFSERTPAMVVKLPSTTLKYRTDTPEPPEGSEQPGLWPRGRLLSPSASQETLRPTRPNHNFLIDDDPEVSDGPWRATYEDDTPSPFAPEDESSQSSLRRTASGMFMPYDETEEAQMHNTLVGQAMNIVYTVKDIAHVVWNVGWHRDRPPGAGPGSSSGSGSSSAPR